MEIYRKEEKVIEKKLQISQENLKFEIEVLMLSEVAEKNLNKGVKVRVNEKCTAPLGTKITEEDILCFETQDNQRKASHLHNSGKVNENTSYHFLFTKIVKY